VGARAGETAGPAAAGAQATAPSHREALPWKGVQD